MLFGVLKAQSLTSFLGLGLYRAPGRSSLPTLLFPILQVRYIHNYVAQTWVMFSLGLSSVLGNRDNHNKKGHSAKNDEWYIPYNGPYETPPRDATTWMRKPRDSWGDPIPLGAGDENLELSGSEGVGSKRLEYERHTAVGGAGMKYGVHGVFDDDWKSMATSGVGRYAEDRERGRRTSRGHDYQPTAVTIVDAGRNNHSPTTPRRLSTISSGPVHAVPDYVSLDGASGGVGESPMPNSRGPKDTQRVSLASIFTFGAKMKTGSPTRSLDGGRERRDSTDSSLKRSRRNTGSTKDKAHGRVDMPLDHRDSAGSLGDNVQHQNYPVATVSTKQSITKKHVHRQSVRHNSLGTEDEIYYNYYDSFYSTLVNDSPTDTNAHSDPASRQTTRRQQHLPKTVDNSNVTPQLQQRPPRVSTRQILIPTAGGHPYAPYSHHSHLSKDDNRDLHDDRIPSPSGRVPTVDKPLVFRQPRHPYNQAQSTHKHHHYGQSSVSTGASSSSNQSHLVTSRSTPSHGHQEPRQTPPNPHSRVAFPAQGPVASELGSSGVGTTPLGLGAGLTGKKLRNATSTPNLYHNQAGNFQPVAGLSNRQVGLSVSMVQQTQPPPVIKDRWLSAETWCDALIFPRPRLKVKQDNGTYVRDQPAEKSPISSRKGSGRIVSPPGSPPGRMWDIETTSGTETRNRFGQHNQKDGRKNEKQREPGVASRVLAHSRSLVDLRPPFSTAQERYPSVMPPEIASTGDEGLRGTRKVGEMPRSPISPEELALATAVPSVSE